jgi:hypothetical protein
MDLQRFRILSARDRALVAIAVLMDGRDAGGFLESDAVNGPALKRAADALSELPPDLRMPLTGTLLRLAVEEVGPSHADPRHEFVYQDSSEK